MGVPINNKNAEKWTFEESDELFNEAIALTTSYEHDFIGEVAKELGLYKEVFTYLVGKFPELNHKYKIIISNCETNCFHNGKKGNINPSLAIMNLKSNHNWTDRIDNTTKDKEITQRPQIIFSNGSKTTSEIREDLDD
jgi:hypothetical protein